MTSFQVETTIKAPLAEVWQALGTIGDIYLWNPGVLASHTTSKRSNGLGATRICDLGGKNYLNEEVVAWEPNKKLTMRITETNLPFATADIRFALREENEQTIVTVSPLYSLKFGLLGKLLDWAYVRHTYQKGMSSLLAGLKQFVEKEQEILGKD